MRDDIPGAVGAWIERGGCLILFLAIATVAAGIAVGVLLGGF